MQYTPAASGKSRVEVILDIEMIRQALGLLLMPATEHRG